MINRRSLLEGIKNQFYILEWLPDYQKQDFLADLKSGITVGMIEVPQVMAYAVIAGLSPIYGLYGSLIPLLIYPLFGTVLTSYALPSFSSSCTVSLANFFLFLMYRSLTLWTGLDSFMITFRTVTFLFSSDFAI